MEAAIGDCEALLESFSGLLRIAQVEAGARRAGFAALDLSALVATVAEVHAPEAEARGQVLAVAVPPGVAGFGDRELLTQAFSNLVDNAVKHGGAGGRIRVALLPGPAVVVEDDGPGVPEAERAAVLRRFHRLDRSRSLPGNGLGLALVAAVAELHGAALRLEDAAPGLRVTFAMHPPQPHPDPAGAAVGSVMP